MDQKTPLWLIILILIAIFIVVLGLMWMRVEGTKATHGL
jgi:hypothetical protein